MTFILYRNIVHNLGGACALGLTSRMPGGALRRNYAATNRLQPCTAGITRIGLAIQSPYAPSPALAPIIAANIGFLRFITSYYSGHVSVYMPAMKKIVREDINVDFFYDFFTSL